MLNKTDLNEIANIMKLHIDPVRSDIHELKKDFENFTFVVKNQFDRVDERFDQVDVRFDFVDHEILDIKKIQLSHSNQLNSNTDNIRILKSKLT